MNSIWNQETNSAGKNTWHTRLRTSVQSPEHKIEGKEHLSPFSSDFHMSPHIEYAYAHIHTIIIAIIET